MSRCGCSGEEEEMKILHDRPDEPLSLEEIEFWEMDNYRENMKELNYYRRLCGDSYRILNKPKKVRLTKQERLFFK